ncbi:MAG TPA: sulfite oxidase [Thermoanaerobaculia bacterium]|nr:sulfite oxidase [Thermoanaerobaculia bacterium]
MPPSIDRRRFLLLAGTAALLPAASKISAPSVPISRRRMLQLNGYATDAETPLDALTTYLTPNDLFFVRHHWNPAYQDERRWSLTVDGEVERPLRLTIADLKRMPRATATCVLQCAGNGRALHKPVVPGVQWRYGAVGNARWTGVRVKELLDRAGLKAGARHAHTFGADKPPSKTPPFRRSVEIEKLLEDGIVAWEMNGEPLMALHGAPARLVVPGWSGNHWMKWIERISAQPESQKGFYMETGYRYPNQPGEPGVPVKAEDTSPVTSLFVKSNITEAPAAGKVGAPLTIRGFAFSGAPDIAKVEITDDGGQTWYPAALDPQHDPYAWRLWSYRYEPKAPGTVVLAARATDSRGSVQPKEAAWNPSGYLYNAWHSVEIPVTA